MVCLKVLSLTVSVLPEHYLICFPETVGQRTNYLPIHDEADSSESDSFKSGSFKS